MDRGAWWAAVHGVAGSWTWLSDFTFTFHFHAFEKEMATHSSVLAWRIPGMAEPGGLLSMGSHRVRHDWATEMNWTEVSVSFQFLMQKKEEEERVLRWKMLKTIRRQHEWPSPLGFRQSPMNSKGSANHCVYQISLQGRITGGVFTLMPVSHTGHRSESPRGRSYCVYRCIFHAPGDFILPQRLRLSARRPDDQILPTFSLSQPDFPRLSGLSS